MKVVVQMNEGLSQAIAAAKKLAATGAALVHCKHGLFYVTVALSGSFIQRIGESVDGLREVAFLVDAQTLEKSLYRAKAVTLQFNPDHIVVSPRASSRIKLTELVNDDFNAKETVSSVKERWEAKSNKSNTKMLLDLLKTNSSFLQVKNRIEDKKPIPVHIRYGKDFIHACMADTFHGVLIRYGKDSGKGRNLHIYGHWMPLLLSQLQEEGSNINIFEDRIEVATNSSILTLRAVAKDLTDIDIDRATSLLKQEGRPCLITIGEVATTVQRCLAILKETTAVQVSTNKTKGFLQVKGQDDSGSQIIEKTKIRDASRHDEINCNVVLYNLLDIIPDVETDATIQLAGKALLVEFNKLSQKDTMYNIATFTATSSGVH